MSIELTEEMLKDQLKNFQIDVEKTVGDIAVKNSEEAKGQIAALQAEVNTANSAVEALRKQIAESRAAGLPGLTDELEKQNFSLTNYVQGLYKSHPKQNISDPWKNAGYELDIVKSYAKIRANYADDGSAGAYLIPPEVSNEIIDLAMAATPLFDLGVTVIRGLRGELPVPTLTGRPSGYWVGENSAPTESQATYGVKTLRPKKLGAFTKQSNRLIYQSSGVSDQIIKRELAKSMGLKMNEGLTIGSGSEYQPKGIMNQEGFTTSTAGTAGVLGANGARFRLDHAAIMRKDLDVANELAMPGQYGYFMRPEAFSGLSRERVLQYSDQAENTAQPIMAINPLMSSAKIEEILGYKLRTTTQLSAVETQGTSTTCSSILFGNFEMYWVGMWRDFALKVSDQAGDGSTGSAFLDDQLYIVAFQELDAQGMRPSAFTKVTGASTTESEW